jgi:hypothetical protein
VHTRALAALDGHVSMAGPLVTVSSNRSPNELDPARVRAGWLGIHVRFDLPDEPERAERCSMVEDWWCEAEFGAAARSMIGEPRDRWPTALPSIRRGPNRRPQEST